MNHLIWVEAVELHSHSRMEYMMFIHITEVYTAV